MALRGRLFWMDGDLKVGGFQSCSEIKIIWKSGWWFQIFSIYIYLLYIINIYNIYIYYIYIYLLYILNLGKRFPF